MFFFQYGHPMLTAVNRWDQLDGIGYHDVAEEHIWPSKYDSRQTIVSRICDALEELGIISLCGKGATSLAMKLAIEVERQRSFPSVAIVRVPRNPNLEKIRQAILQQIGQTQIDECLLILDGFWWKLNNEDFEAIGVPSPNPRFRIVFISRNEDMCKKIGSHQIHHIDFLEDEEALDLFREIAGRSVLDLNNMARKIVDECGDGFHIVILTIASTLNDKPQNVWEDTLGKLQNMNRIHKSDVEKVFSRIDISYNLLNDREAQLMFLLCCLFPENFNIPVEDLVLFAKGLQLFENVDGMHQERDRVERIIQKLKDSFFLLNGDGDEFVKLHDMLRDFGLVMSSKWEHPYVVRCDLSMNEWPLDRTKYQNYTAMSFMCQIIEQHPADLKCPNLHFLQLSYGNYSARLPNGIFEGLKNLKVLSLSIPSVSHSLTVLKKLRTLCITESISDNRYRTPRPRIGDLLGYELENLEVFSFSTARPYDDFPREIGLLRNLRYLRFNRERLKYIQAGVLSKLEKLEELYLPQDFISWGCKEEGGDRINASLSEIESLHLTSLTIGTSTSSVLAEKFVKKLARFCVFIGSHVSPDYEFATSGSSKKSLQVFDADADDFTERWISALVRKSESLRLKQVRNLKIIFAWQWEPEENQIPQWKKICISDCNELEYITAGWIPLNSLSHLESLKLFGLHNLKEIWQGLYLLNIEESCFGNLCEIQIMFCRKLKYVFSVPVAAKLKQLRSLEICFCDEMEEIFHRERMNIDGSQVEENSEIIFPQLRTLELAYMDKLRILYNGNHHAILLPSLESLSVFQCNHLEAFSNGLLAAPSLQQIQINGNQYSVTEDLNAVLKNLNRSRIDQVRAAHETRVT